MRINWAIDNQAAKGLKRCNFLQNKQKKLFRKRYFKSCISKLFQLNWLNINDMLISISQEQTSIISNKNSLLHEKGIT